MAEILVEVRRGELTELVFRGDVAVVDATGRLLCAAGDPAVKQTYWRSSAKPFQAMVAVYTGAAARFGLGSADLALLCGSHSGEPVHTEGVLSILRRLGLGPESLQCGAHPPTDGATALELERRAEAPGSLHSNCSGKHAGMLAICVHLGADPNTYRDADHPVQRLIRENIASCADLPLMDVGYAVDGCGVPTFALTVDRMALAFARLVQPAILAATVGQENGVPGLHPPDGDARAAAAAQVGAAMTGHPYLVAGRRRLDTDLMQVTHGRLLAKMGADGVYCIGVPPAAAAASPVLGPQLPPGGFGVGVAIKMEAGVARYREVVAVETLRQLGLLTEQGMDALAGYHAPPVLSVAGQRVGEVQTVFRLCQGFGAENASV